MFVPELLKTVNYGDIIASELKENDAGNNNTEKTFRKKTLTKIFNALYTSKCSFAESTFDIFSNTNLKEV